ncbi:glycosyltransferase [Galbibacter orientalis]|uniref:glycosyltransferase n=1 Tax=Galbibacter orientalis TaxID=453852 RepID=UPI003000FB5E
MFNHFIITRFNLRKDDWKISKNNSPVLTKKWLENRFVLFENFCIPSVKSQTNKNFKWLVFFDKNTPNNFKKKIESYKFDFENFTPVYVDGMSKFLPTIQKILNENTSDYIITSRIDNDDSISKNYIEEVQKTFNKQTYTGVDFLDGYTLQISPNIKLGKRKQAFNPFISLIEKNENPKSVWHKTHSGWKKEKQVIRVPNKRVWMSIIHFENKVNEFVGYGKVNLQRLFDEFHLDKTIQNQILENIIDVSDWKFQSKKNEISSQWRTSYKDIKRKLSLYK